MLAAVHATEAASLIEEARAEAGGKPGTIHLAKYVETIRHFVHELRAMEDRRQRRLVLSFPRPKPF